MSGIQKVIKYCALAFAAFLIISIVSSIMGVFAIFSYAFDTNKKISETYNDLKINDNSRVLDIDLVASGLIIKKGDTFKAESNNKYINIEQDNNNIYINEKRNGLFYKYNGDLIIYIPEDYKFDEISINSGAGKIDIDSLFTEILKLDVGAGTVNIDNLNVIKDCKIESGAGEVRINNGSINNVDLDLGVGKITLTSAITGTNKINSGVGATNINIIGIKEDYKISVDKGIGSVRIAGEDVTDNTNYGNGLNKIDIDGGVGSIEVKFIS